MRPEHLLPHESPCDCEDGYRPVMHPCTSSAAEEPFLATGRREVCTDCDGTQVRVTNRRDALRPDVETEIGKAFVDLRWTITEQYMAIEKLQRIVEAQGHLLDKAEMTAKENRHATP